MRKIIACLIVVNLTICVAVLPFKVVFADNATQKKSIDNKINDINKQQAEAKKKLEQLKSTQSSLTKSSNEEKKTYEQLTKEKDLLLKQIADLDAEVKESEKRYELQKKVFKKRIQLMYENNDTSNLETIMTSKSLSDLLERLEIMTIISNNDKRLIDSILSAKKDVEYKKEQKKKLQAEVEKKAGTSFRNLQALLSSRSNVDSELKRIKSVLESLEEQENELIKKSNELEALIRGVQSKGKYSGQMIWPSANSRTITSYHGTRLHPVLKVYKTHTGIDIGASYGTSILAASSGTVILSGWQSGYGNTIIIDHGGGISTLYGHSSKLLVSEGQKVSAGQVIAKVGSTGMSTGPHLHFEVRKNGTPVNPLDYVK